MHGLGNDFIVIDGISQRLDGLPLDQMAQRWCDRHFGIGADGLILVTESQIQDFKMQIFNSDGSEPETCGNGIRCFAKFVYDNGLSTKEVFSVETGAGPVLPALILKEGRVESVEVDMGVPILTRSKIPMKGPDQDQVLEELIRVDGHSFPVTAVSMGNPHAVIFVSDLRPLVLERLGPKLEKHPVFPKGVNVEFVQVLNKQEAVMVVWERGAGETLACGTGACAVLVAGVLLNKLDRQAVVHLPGGDLLIEWQEDTGHVMMTGPIETVFQGESEFI